MQTHPPAYAVDVACLDSGGGSSVRPLIMNGSSWRVAVYKPTRFPKLRRSFIICVCRQWRERKSCCGAYVARCAV